MSVTAFSALGNTVNIAATTASQAVTVPGDGNQVKVLNNSPVIAFIQFALSAAVAAVATSMPVLPNSDQVFSVPLGTLSAAAILPSGTGTVYFTRGEGQ